jgi:ADP-ribose pyrophosphatase
MSAPRRRASAETLAQGRFLRLVHAGGWEYAERVNASGVVAVVAVTPEREIILTEQYRPAVKQRVIDMPAGLAGDIPGEETEALATAARRELLEETGYRARRMEFLTSGPPSAGMSSEIVTFFLATGCRRVADGGGDDHEEIDVHVVPLAKAAAWLRKRSGKRRCVDPKVYAALYFAERADET